MKKITRLFICLFIGILFISGSINVSAYTRDDMSSDINMFGTSGLIGYQYVTISGHENGKVYYQLIDVTENNEVLANIDEYNAKVKEWEDLKDQIRKADEETKKELLPKEEAMRNELISTLNLYYELIVPYVEENFIYITDLSSVENTGTDTNSRYKINLPIQNSDVQDNHTYLLWVKLESTSDTETTNEYNHTYFKKVSNGTIDKEGNPGDIEEPGTSVDNSDNKEEKPATNPDTMVENPYIIAIPVLLVAGLGTVVLKNRYNH